MISAASNSRLSFQVVLQQSSWEMPCQVSMRSRSACSVRTPAGVPCALARALDWSTHAPVTAADVLVPHYKDRARAKHAQSQCQAG